MEAQHELEELDELKKPYKPIEANDCAEYAQQCNIKGHARGDEAFSPSCDDDDPAHGTPTGAPGRSARTPLLFTLFKCSR